jgi:hypothetical protein
MQLLCWWFQKSEKKIQVFYYKIIHGPCLYWLIWNFEKRKSFGLHAIFIKIICGIAHLFFYIFISNHYIYCSTSTWPQALHHSLKTPISKNHQNNLYNNLWLLNNHSSNTLILNINGHVDSKSASKQPSWKQGRLHKIEASFCTSNL